MDGTLCDTYRIADDFIQLSHAHHVFILDDTICILAVSHQAQLVPLIGRFIGSKLYQSRLDSFLHVLSATLELIHFQHSGHKCRLGHNALAIWTTISSFKMTQCWSDALEVAVWQSLATQRLQNGCGVLWVW